MENTLLCKQIYIVNIDARNETFNLLNQVRGESDIGDANYMQGS